MAPDNLTGHTGEANAILVLYDNPAIQSGQIVEVHETRDAHDANALLSLRVGYALWQKLKVPVTKADGLVDYETEYHIVRT